MSKKVTFTTPDVLVKYSDLLRPDVYKGTSSHKVQVMLDDEMMELLDKYREEVGAVKINGIRETEEGMIGSFKCRLYTKEGIDVFPEVYDSQGVKTKTVPFGGATVRLKLSSYVIQDDNTVSFMLNSIQVIDLGREEQGPANFTPVEGGFVTANVAGTDDTDRPDDDDIPF